MTHSFVTIIASVPTDRIAALRVDIEALGNPANAALAGPLDAMQRIHFTSINLFEASAADRGHLVFEFSGDGPRDELIDLLAGVLEAPLAPIFAPALDRGTGSLAAFWKAHVVATDQALFANPGLDFTGSPGLSVERIKKERDLAAHVAALLGQPQPAVSAFAIFEKVRNSLRSSAWSWALQPEPIVDTGITVDVPSGGAGLLSVGAKLAGPFAKAFLWPFILPFAIFFALALCFEGAAWRSAPLALAWAILATIALVGGTAFSLYLALRRREDAELPIDRPPAAGAVGAIMQRENFIAQNHLAALSVIKPGRLRRLTLMLAFWVIGQLASRLFRPGFLGTLGSIHFARWVTVPGTNDLLFLSNFGGSWESYLEDFITKAHAGLTGVWSNTLGFPKTTNLFGDGATDGERFKRWARRQQVPTAFWYSAYPDITTSNIRSNAAIRQGLGTISTESEARKWLAQFGSAVRPVGELESNEIQSLLLGGLGFLHAGEALLFSLSADKAKAKAWLAEQLPAVSFSDGRSLHEAMTLGLSASALPKLGLPGESIGTFPAAFTDGMTAPYRSRLLGDVGDNAPDKWWWGGDPAKPIDGVLLLYGKTPAALAGLHDRAVRLLQAHGHVAGRSVPFRPLAEKSATAEEHFAAKCEPFGFVDGISQPVIRGTYKALRGADAIHLVEPGEFILGYPDNRGTIPPGPVVAASDDPANILPTTAETTVPVFSASPDHVERDLGRNGNFLAIRQLEQDVDAFWEFCNTEGERLKPSFPPGIRASAGTYVAAKIVGRWQDGSPLTRYPRYPASKAPVPAHPLARTTTAGSPQRPGAAAAIPPSASDARRGTAARVSARSTGDDGPPHDRSGADHAKPEPLFEPDNDFLFGSEDPQGLRCPFGAHIRRANPRESFVPGSTEQLGITNRHRIMRIGRFYEPQEGQKQGLFFMCLNGDLERQFEFVQQTWLHGAAFHDLVGERDPLLGGAEAGCYTIPTRNGPMRLENLSSFVRTRGGGYFFLPGRRTLQYLAA